MNKGLESLPPLNIEHTGAHSMHVDILGQARLKDNSIEVHIMHNISRKDPEKAVIDPAADDGKASQMAPATGSSGILTVQSLGEDEDLIDRIVCDRLTAGQRTSLNSLLGELKVASSEVFNAKEHLHTSQEKTPLPTDKLLLVDNAARHVSGDVDFGERTLHEG
ncbi:hypothetical protein FQN49_004281 [Arthroderma sp. PD_2]|nr:hypothetical protein FQN49_004281 [Arthroderma sp. PD_2]